MKTDSNGYRIFSVQQQLGTACALIEDPLNLLYLTHLKLSAGKLLISPHRALLLLDGRYLQLGEEKSPIPVAKDSKEALQQFLEETHTTKLHFDSLSTSYDRFTQLQTTLPHCQLIPDEALFTTIRSCKSAQEIKLMQSSAELLWKGFLYIQSRLLPGVTEKTIAKEFEIFCLQHGAQALSFEPIIAFGTNTAFPHYRAGNAILQKNDIALIDIGVVLDDYHSDMTRTLLLGTPDPKLAHFLSLTKQAHAAALALCRPGTPIKEIDLAARAVFKNADVESLFTHSLGHGIGLQTHEFPRVSAAGKDQNVPLKEGMVITIEPGLYLPGCGGVRYEDTLVITPHGYHNFYH